jgi:steroid 5-alpha reductase family enzyme
VIDVRGQVVGLHICSLFSVRRRFLKQKFFIDSHKGITFIAVLVMMGIYQQWDNVTAWVYLAMHGTYGLLWVTKSRIFPDKQWEQECSIWYGLYIWAGLSLYWIAPWLITSQDVTVRPWLLSAALLIYIVGVFLHFTSDMQKYIELKYNPDHLITDGLMAYSRNMNYLGEFLIYGAFAVLAMSWIPFAVIAAYFVIIWIPNIRRKEKSLSRYPEFKEYKKSVKLFIPYIL